MTRQRGIRKVSLGQILVCAAAFLILVAGVCLLPYVYPPGQFIKGASAAAGFNNAVAYLWYVGFLWVPVLILSRILFRTVTLADRLWLGRPVFNPTGTVWCVLVAHALLFGALYAYKGRYIFAEALYFQTLLYRMTAGEVPYLDFSFYYGPAMLYPAYFLTYFMSVEAAYAVSFVATYLAGLYLLSLAIRLIVPDPRSGDRWFLVLAIGFFNPWTGLNVTFVRFLLPVLACLLAAWYVRTGRMGAFIGAVCALATAMLYTFEAGVVGVAGVTLMVLMGSSRRIVAGVLRVQPDRTGIGPAPDESGSARPSHGAVPPRGALLRRAGAVIGTSLVFLLGGFALFDPSLRALLLYPAIALSYSAGAHNLPIYPNLPALTLLLLTVVALALAVVVMRRGALAGYEDLALVALAVVLLMERGAFGVAEPTHFAYYGLPLFLFCVYLVSPLPTNGPLVKGLAVVLLVGVALPMQYYHASLVLPFIERYAAERETHHAQQQPVVRPEVITGASVEKTLASLVTRIGSDRPYLMFQLDYYSYPVYRKLGLRYPTYFTFLTNARTFNDVDLVIAQLEQSRAVVLARRSDLVPAMVESHRSGLQHWLDRLSGAHTAGSELAEMMRASEERLLEPLRRFLADSYSVGPEEDGIVALLPREVGAKASEGLRRHF